MSSVVVGVSMTWPAVPSQRMRTAAPLVDAVVGRSSARGRQRGKRRR